MAKQLYLVRHAEAAKKESRQEDRARELTPAGIKDSLHLGAWFLEKNLHFDLLISSSAMRSEQTAMMVAEGMKVQQPRILLDDILYEASVRQFLDVLNNIEDGYDNVLCVGHNPSISYLAEYLTKGDIGEMTPGSVAIIKFDFSSWKQIGENSGELVRLVTPEMVVKY